MSLFMRRRMLIAQQKKSKNLCDVNYFLANCEGSPYSYVRLYVGIGNPVTVSVADKLPLGLGFYLAISYQPFTGSNEYITWLYHTSAEVHCKKSYTFISTQDYIYVNVLRLENFEANVGYLQVEINDHATEYEPYY